MIKKNSFKFSRVYKRWDMLLLFSIVIAAIVYLISLTTFMQEIELKLTDYRFRLSPQPAKADTNVVIVAIDDGSLDYFRHNGVSFPWPRSFYRHTVDFFKVAGASAVIFDMQFYEPDLERDETSSEETDGEFAEAILRNQRICLAAHLYDEDLPIDVDLSNFAITDIELNSSLEEKYGGILLP